MFAPSKSSEDNLFKPISRDPRLFSGDRTSFFSGFIGGTPTIKASLSNDIVPIDSNSSESRKNDQDELKKLEWEKQKIEMEIRKEEEAERLRKEESEKLQREKEVQERIEKERKEQDRIKMEKEKADALKRLQRIEQVSEETVAEVIDEFVREELEQLAETALELYNQIESATEDIYCELLAEIIFEESAEWERIYQLKIAKIESTPIWVPDKSLLEAVPDLMHPLQDETLNMSQRYRHGMPKKIASPTTLESMIDVFEIIPQQLNRNSTKIERIRKRPAFWKCGISLPTSTEDKSCQRIEKWFDKLFVHREPVHSTTFFCEQQFVRSVQQEVAISLRKFRGTEMSNENGVVDAIDRSGMNAIVFIMSASKPTETKKRLQKILEHKSANCTIGIVMLTVDKNHDLRSELQLDELGKDPDCSIKYFYAKEDTTPLPSARNRLLIKCFKWVASNFNFKSYLEMQTTASFFDQCLGNQFWHRILTSAAHNPGLFKAATNIGFVIDTYNTALDHLDNVITEDLSSHPLFPEEFKRYVKLVTNDIPVEYQCFPNDWKNPIRLNQLRTFMTSLRLQPLTLKTSSLEDIQDQLLSYAHRHITDKPRSDRAAYRMIKVLLEYFASTDDQHFQQQITSFNWIDSVRLLTLEILLFQYDIKAQNIPREVIYNREKFKHYLNDPWWLQDNSPMNQVRLSFDRLEEVDGPKAKKSKLNTCDRDEIDRLVARGTDALQKADAKIDKFKTTVNIGREITHELDSLLYEHERNLRVQKRWSQMELSD